MFTVTSTSFSILSSLLYDCVEFYEDAFMALLLVTAGRCTLFALHSCIYAEQVGQEEGEDEEEVVLSTVHLLLGVMS